MLSGIFPSYQALLLINGQANTLSIEINWQAGNFLEFNGNLPVIFMIIRTQHWLNGKTKGREANYS